jgi:hypothetical protein
LRYHSRPYPCEAPMLAVTETPNSVEIGGKVNVKIQVKCRTKRI